MRGRYVAAGLCILFFMATQGFQQVAYHFWIIVFGGPQAELLSYLQPADRARALLVMAGILALVVPFAVIALRCFPVAPLASVLGLAFGCAFVGLELVHRSIDFFVVGNQWANQLVAASSDVQRAAILQRFALWNELVQGWYFPLLLCYLIASCAFVAATWKDAGRGGFHILAPAAYALNALRLLARMLGMFAGQAWVGAFNGELYFPAAFAINALLAIWFFALAREKTEGERLC